MEVFQLDLSAEDGDGLLVPFRNAMENIGSNRNDPNPAFAPLPVQKKRRGLFFRRSRENQLEESKDSCDEKETLVKENQALPLSFPNAPSEYADKEQSIAPLAETGKGSFKTDKTQRTEEEEEEEEEDSQEESSDEDDNEEEEEEEEDSQEESSDEDENEEENSVNEQENHAPTSSHYTNEQSRDLMQQDSPRLKMDGYGTHPQVEKRPWFWRLRRPEMKTMKIATEATKDDRTIGETVAHCFNIAILPEIYCDDMEGDGNLGFYGPLFCDNNPPSPKPLTEMEKALECTAEWKAHALKLRTSLKNQLAHIHKLEEDLKSKDLEAMSWKLRARELETQLKQYQDGSDIDDDSSVDDKACENCDFESEIDHEWEEEVSTVVKEEILVNTDIAPEKVEFDPLSKRKGAPGQSKGDADERKNLVDLILSLSADVDTFKDEKATPNENHENTSSSNSPSANLHTFKVENETPNKNRENTSSSEMPGGAAIVVAV
jgi:hypothetical protein